MKRNIHFLAAAMAAAPFGLFGSIAGAGTINFGPAVTPGAPTAPSVPNGYAGFNWGNATNDYDGFTPFFLTAPSAFIDQFSGSTPFDLNSVTFQNFMSEASGDGQVSTYSTVISGYLGGTLVSSVTENYGWGGTTITGINLDDVNKVTFSTHALITDSFCCDSMGNIETITQFNGPDQTFVSSLKVSAVTAAPEIDPASGASALTLLAGAILVLSRRVRPQCF